MTVLPVILAPEHRCASRSFFSLSSQKKKKKRFNQSRAPSKKKKNEVLAMKNELFFAEVNNLLLKGSSAMWEAQYRGI